MARNAQSQARTDLLEAERAERELNDDINEAIARTDSEVFTEAMGDEPIGEADDTTLEDMGEGLEGDELEPEPGEELPPEEQPPPSQQVQQLQEPSIPPRVLREVRERHRENESNLQRQILEQQAQINNLMLELRQRPPTAPAAPAAPEQPPDMFSDQPGYAAYLERRAEQRADARVAEQLTAFRQQQRQETEQRLNANLEATATGPRAYEFHVAYRDLMSLDKTPENAAVVRQLIAQPDVGQAILDWWERSSNPEYVEYHRDQIRRTYGAPQPPGRGVNGRQQIRSQDREQFRHEVRIPPSLSDAVGGRSQHVVDPDLLDSSERSVFEYGSRR